MLPLGLALIADDVPGLKCRLEQAACWLERIWHRLRRPRSKHKAEFSEIRNFRASGKEGTTG